MNDQAEPNLNPHRVYRDLRVVADTEEYPGHLVIGVLVDGALVPIATQPLGLVDAIKTRWSDLGGAHAEPTDSAATASLEQRVATLERAALSAGKTLEKPPAKPKTPPAK
jgi:hypothetical protein